VPTLKHRYDPSFEVVEERLKGKPGSALILPGVPPAVPDDILPGPLCLNDYSRRLCRHSIQHVIIPIAQAQVTPRHQLRVDTTSVIPHHRDGVHVEFGRPVVLYEMEGGPVMCSYVLADGASDSGQALATLVCHQQFFRHVVRSLSY